MARPHRALETEDKGSWSLTTEDTVQLGERCPEYVCNHLAKYDREQHVCALREAREAERGRLRPEVPVGLVGGTR